jgi:soluble lytic murein transglycosylase-like protein
MAVEKGMTIRDHLEPSRAATAGARIGTAARRRFGVFEDMLKSEKNAGAAPASAAGLKISEYLKRPVGSLQVRRATDAAVAAGLSASAATAAVRTSASASDAAAPTVDARPSLRPARSRSVAGSDGTRDAAIETAVRQAASRYNLPPDLIRSVIRAESNFQPTAVSSAGAMGLMQLMPDTARDLGVTNAFDVRQNVDGGARYLRQMLDRFNGDLKLALQAYNAGPGAVEQYKGDVPFAETRQYVKRVLSYAGLKA